MPLDKFPFPTISIPGQQAEQRLLRMRVELQHEGLIPVIIGEPENALRLTENWNFSDQSFEDALRIAGQLRPEGWFQKRLDDDPEAFCSLEETGAHNGAQPMRSLMVGFDYRGHPHEEVLIATIPTSDYWTIPLHLRVGGWNACPGSAEHAMVARYWEQRYGARIAAVTLDTVEFTVERSPESPQDCANLARERNLCCADNDSFGGPSQACFAAKNY